MVRDEINFIICYIAQQTNALSDLKRQNNKFNPSSILREVCHEKIPPPSVYPDIYPLLFIS